MLDSEREESLIESDIRISERSVSSPHTTEVFLFDCDSGGSSASVQRTKNDGYQSDADWRNSAMSLTMERPAPASIFLNPSPTKSSACTFSHFDLVDFQSVVSDGLPKMERLASDSYVSSDGRLKPPRHARHHTSPSIIITSLAFPNKREHIRSISGTQTIMGLREALPDVFELQRINTPTPPNSICVSYASHTIGDRKSVVDDHWSDEYSDDLISSSKNFRWQIDRGRSKSRGGSELFPPSDIWISGGPSPGLYVNRGKENGRNKWIGSHAYISWNPNARAWLLVSRNTKRNDSALAMLCVDSNNPCISNIQWRVGIGAKRGVVYSFYDSYAFRLDRKMKCTRYFGSDKVSALPLIEESTLVKVRCGLGVVRFVGQLNDQNGIFAGVELFTPTGLNNGTRNGCHYFDAKPQHGIFVRIPGAIKHIFGPVNDRVSMLLDDLIVNVRKIIQISEAAIERLVKIMVLLEDGQPLFCGHKIKILGIILYFELIML